MLEINTKWNYTREVLPPKGKVVLVITPYRAVKFYPAIFNGNTFVSSKGDDTEILNVTLWADINVVSDLVEHAKTLASLDNILS